VAAPHLTEPAGAPPASGAAGQPPSAVEAAYRRLTPEQARVYRLSALRAWPALSAGPVAAAAGIGEPDADRVLAELAEHLLLDVAPDGRYRYRPAVRTHAAEAAAREDGLAECAAAVSRTTGWFVRFAVRADLAALPERWHVGPLFEQLGPGPYDSPGAAVAALMAELDNLVESVLAAAEFGDHDTACQGTEALWAVQLKAGPYDTLLPALRAGARAAQAHRPGTDMAGRLHAQLALALMEMPALREEAEAELTAAADADARAGHVRGQATAVETLGLLRLRQWRYAEALDCFGAAGRLLDGIGPGDRGAADLPRARALLERHQGRALRGLGRFAEALPRLENALAFFRAPGTAEPYNEARVLTDMAEAHRDAGDPEAALRLAEQAAVLLTRENAAVHLGYLDLIRRQCRPEQA
jgi:tetratricopeptide (TPR) repeat protein